MKKILIILLILTNSALSHGNIIYIKKNIQQEEVIKQDPKKLSKKELRKLKKENKKLQKQGITENKDSSANKKIISEVIAPSEIDTVNISNSAVNEVKENNNTITPSIHSESKSISKTETTGSTYTNNETTDNNKNTESKISDSSKILLLIIVVFVLFIWITIYRYNRRCKKCKKWNAMKVTEKKLVKELPSTKEKSITNKDSKGNSYTKKYLVPSTKKTFHIHRKCKYQNCGHQDYIEKTENIEN